MSFTDMFKFFWSFSSVMFNNAWSQKGHSASLVLLQVFKKEEEKQKL